MSDPRVAHRRLVEHALANTRQLPLAMLLELLAPVQQLRALAREFGVSPKGGFRLDKAPARVLAPLLADLSDGDRLERVVGTLFPARSGPLPPSVASEPADDVAEPSPGITESPTSARGEKPVVDPMRELREAELTRVREELARARESAARGLERESALRRQLQATDEEMRQLRGQALRVRPAAGPARIEADRDLTTRLHELEQEIAAREAADAALRRQLAADKSRLRDLEEEFAELEQLVPKGRRRRRIEEPPPPQPSERRFLVPTFAPSFYRSLDGKDRTAVERAFIAAWLLCTEGHAYPSLEVKMLGGQDTWSLRASLGLRVYFRNREDGGIEFLEVADREDQHTTLRRLKDR